MQNIILEKPYEFVPPVESGFWCWAIRFWLRSYLEKNFSVTSFDVRGAEKLRASIDEGKGVIVAPNHSRLSDPMVLGMLSKEAGTQLFAMASWHLFEQNKFERFLIRRMGAFSVYREGNDRQAVNFAIDILVQGRRPLVMFPEGAVSRHCDLVMDLMDGPAFIARQAAKKRQKQGRPPVVIHPVAIRYYFDGDVEATIGPDLDALEHRFSWQPQTHLTLTQRLGKLGRAILAAKEIEYLGAAREGDPHERADRLMQEVLEKLEEKWGTVGKEKGVVGRVKALRSVILPDMIAGKVTPEERSERWRDLAECYYLQQLAHYPQGYIGGGHDLPERLLETIERMEEDFTDESKYHGPLHCVIQVGDAIEVDTERDRSAAQDPAMTKTAESLQGMLDAMVAERRAELAARAES
ncbi:1-acyl-sn-glycerol-3-phosphate acyltransferase [Posidoniimonas polymericola]|uniref:1-acyl-sn-glycerol-3-phosphate acyltransferase n=1 Tax=Posidoniimonas polymericola TaxID=2528002 RepID=A0A5C5XVE5_9BACT|nr:lysophospholipid acyltransferase family protein [Posidoniimonas polymericola]TWT66864.1 1-acyl-sn-glycerol-3-phosphate acyltransferase [Posidoniimonas polymericola]